MQNQTQPFTKREYGNLLRYLRERYHSAYLKQGVSRDLFSNLHLKGLQERIKEHYTPQKWLKLDKNAKLPQEMSDLLTDFAREILDEIEAIEIESLKIEALKKQRMQPSPLETTLLRFEPPKQA